ncbi:hypothetical protein WMY93_019026 [Mugilogobius chulae]|uniref:RING-type domain-containing protein n=1 Tax=Mugilogobius chulae TaxID=88201 RepID=A0AAW0NG09_9GOBI
MEKKNEKPQDPGSLLQLLKEQRIQAVQCERQITAVFARMRHHLQEEQDKAVSALRQEQSRQAQTMGPRLQSLRKTLSSLNNSIQELEKQLQTHSQDFLRTYRPALPPSLWLLPQTPTGLLLNQAKVLGNLGFKAWRSMRRVTFTEPVSLSCHHSFCRSCLQEHWAQQKSRSCPVCRRKSSKDGPGINFALKELSDSLRQKLNVSDQTEQPQASAQTEERKEEKPQDPESLLQSLKEQRNQVRDRVNLYENIVQHSEKQAVQCERQITAVFERMRRHLQEEQDRAVSALRQEQSRQAQTMGPQLQSLRKTLSSLNNSIQELEKQLETHSQDFLRTYRPALPPSPEPLPQTPTGLLLNQAKVLGNLGFRPGAA